MHKITIIEDNDIMRESLRDSLTKFGYQVFPFSSPKKALESIRDISPHLVICDLKLPEMDGLEVVKEMNNLLQDVPVIVITAFGSVDTAVKAMKLGAFDYITKPFNLDEFEIIVKNAIRHRRLVTENEFLRSELKKSTGFEFVLGRSEAMQKIYKTVQEIANVSSTVLITGETGTGKEVVARLIHSMSNRRERPFIAVNCAALSAGLLESELFGHEKGAFTGADKQRIGRFELADTGTLLLDEITEINLDLQAKLLRVLQEKSFERVGSSKPIYVDVRVIATSNRDLNKAVKDGKLREDLFFRLNVIPLYIPPLRERKDDIIDLANFFVKKFSALLSKKIDEISKDVERLLLGYSWPGNVRELENVIERAVILTKRNSIECEDIRAWLRGVTSSESASDSYLGLTLEEIELRAIKANLEYFKGDKQKTAQALGISERTVREKLKNLKN